MSFFTVTGQAEKTNNNLLPHLMLGRFQLRDVSYPDSQVFKISYRSTREAIEALLPPRVEIVGEPVIHFVARHGRNLNWIVGGEANIFGVYVSAAYCGTSETVMGAYWPVLWEDDTMATILGREMLGVAKMHAEVSNPWCLNDEWIVNVSDRGNPIASLRLRHLKPMGDAQLSQARAAAAQGAVIGWRQIPSLGGPEPDLAQAIYLRSPTRIEQAWTGEGEVELMDLDSAIHIWNAPIIETLKRIPLLECVGASMSRGSGEHRLSGLRTIA